MVSRSVAGSYENEAVAFMHCTGHTVCFFELQVDDTPNAPEDY